MGKSLGLEWDTIDSWAEFEELSYTVVTPGSNLLRVYAKDKSGASALYLKDDAGSEREIGPANTVTGTGTANRLAYWTSSSVIAANAALTQNRLVTADSNGLPASHSALTDTHILFANSSGLPAGDSLLTWNNTGKFITLPLKFGAGSDQQYKWSTRAGAFLTLQGQTAATANRFELYTNDGDGTDPLSLTIFAKGTPSALTDFEQLRLEYDESDTTFKLLINAGGTGTVRALKLFTGANTSQLVLNTDGTVNFGSVADAATGFQVNNAGASGTFLRGDGTNYIASTLTIPNTATANQLVYATGSNAYGGSADLTYDGTDLAIGSGKRFRMQSQNRTRYLNSLASAKLSADSTGIAVNTNTVLNFGAENFDTDTLHDTGANTSRLTAAVTGKYYVGYTFYVQTTNVVTPTAVFGFIQKNGSTSVRYAQLNFATVTGVNDYVLAAGSLLSLTANDYVELLTQAAGASGTYDVKTASLDLTTFYMFYVGE